MFKRLDLKGKRFGRLTVIESIDERYSDRSIQWKCVCDCGNIIISRSRSLNNGNTRSCGCLRDEMTHEGLLFIEGTCVTMIRSKKVWKNNTSGTKGVCWQNKTGKWSAYIMFKGRQHHLGLYDNLSDAALIRKQAEEKIFGEFLEWYDTLRVVDVKGVHANG